MATPVVAIVGRANVGKSTLFNRVIGERLSIVEDVPGVTRDRLYAKAEWNGVRFDLIDTGGIEMDETDEMENLIRVQAELAIDEADVILFLVDGRAGLSVQDEYVANKLRMSKKPVVLGVNKLDHHTHHPQSYEFYQLGFGEPIPVSAEHGMGTGDILDEIVNQLPKFDDVPHDDEAIRIAFVGRPNVGKSSMVNRLVGAERVAVSNVAGTTRDAVDTPLVHDGERFVLVDTAGVRRRGKVYESIEKYSVLRALRAMDRADVCFILIDATTGITEQDKRVAGYALDAGKALAFIVNKWDAVDKDDKTAHRFEQEIRSHFPFMRWAPVLFVSALTGQRVTRIFDVARQISNNHSMRVQTSALNRVLADAQISVAPPSTKGRKLKLYYGTQAAVRPPTFIMFVNDQELSHFSYERYLENQLREAFDFSGTPMRIRMRTRSQASED